MSVKNEFNKYIGLIVKDPQRMTCDTDPEGEKLAQLAREKGLMLHFIKAGEPQEPFMADVLALHVTITKDGVPKSKKSWAWRVSGINAD